LADWDAFEKALEKKRKQQLKALKNPNRNKAASLEKTQIQTILQDPKKQEPKVSSPEISKVKKTLSVSDGIEMAAQKSQQRKEKQKKASQQLQEIKAEQETTVQKEPAVQKEIKVEEEIKGDQQNSVPTDPVDDGKLRQWKVRMNGMKSKSREDYVDFYKTIAKKNEELIAKKNEEQGAKKNEEQSAKKSEEQNAKKNEEQSATRLSNKQLPIDSFVHYYLALSRDKEGNKKRNETQEKRGDAKEESKESRDEVKEQRKETVPVIGKAGKEMDSFVLYYLTLRA